MRNTIARIPIPTNEPVYSYAPGTEEREKLKEAIKEIKSQEIEIPLIIGGEEIKTGNVAKIVEPHDTKSVLGVYHMAGEKEINMAIDAAMQAAKKWREYDWIDRAAIFLKAAELLSTKYRYLINAATMLSLSKNVFQAEIDSACELIDFLRFNLFYMQKIYEEQPLYSPKGTWNIMQYRPLEGFIFAVPPFNFVSIAGNLPTAPAMMGNVVLWKPAESSVYAPYIFMKILQEAGLPDGVINFIPAIGREIGHFVFASEHFAGIHFTGSVPTFNKMWQMMAENIHKYKAYPRIVGETGGKDYIFVHKSANRRKLITAIVRGAYEYQGQKCSAVSRVYIPKSMWSEIKDDLFKEIDKIKMGSPEDFTNFMNALIDEKAFKKVTSYIDYAKNASDAEIVKGGGYDNSKGWFVEPTVILTENPHFKTMEEEIFGPVVTIYPYDDDKYIETLHLCDQTSPYGLTGAIFSEDRDATRVAIDILEGSAGNFYINDKPTGAVVGQQPFGGTRGSGTNDKAGSHLNLLRWVTPRAIKENFIAPESFEYPFMAEE
ncbi:L-glutamate gamma-semialdehyde dehydrogenase [Hippea alviniae]|uniref:L-glutamate gamma-semialdehyde dehydrogenase n=1 Tax=Hippea alviniae TaxID=1279027 RepID=UPI0003B3DD36|nr:L-glutamate gamma-semialdehyde dehydrogenase [Hippea alviniae]